MTPVPGHQWPEYARQVWAEFTARSGNPERIMSPAEWWLLRGWLLEGIPLRIVLRGMHDTKRGGLTLAYYANPVKQAYGTWRQAIGGAA